MMREIPDNEERQKIGGYEIISIVAKGGMGVIHKGYDNILNRHLAIKVLSGEFANDSDAIKRFEREGKAITKVRHKNVATIFGFGKTDENLPYLIMELVDGPTFADLIKEKIQFPYSRWCDLFIQICEGLRAAYRQDIVHRDIKPGNIMLNHDDVVKIVDFGLARIIREDTYKSTQGAVVGTPRYMSPEQALGRPTDHRSDIYSLGATLYHILASQPPFEADTTVALMMKHTSAPLPPIYLVNPKVPQDLCEVIHKMLAKDVNERYQDYDEIIDALKNVKIARLAKEKGAQDLSNQMVFKFNQKDFEPKVGSKPESRNEPPPSSYDSTVAMPPPGFPTPAGSAGGAVIKDGIVLSHSNMPDYSQQQPSQNSEQGENSESQYEQGFGGYMQPIQVAKPPRKTRDDNNENIEEYSSSTGKNIIIGVLIASLFIGALVFIYIQMLTGGTAASDDKRNPFARFVYALFTKNSDGKSDKKKEEEIDPIDATMSRLDLVYSSLKEFEAKKGKFPIRMEELVGENLCTREDLKDGWGNKLVFIEASKKLLSFGQDGEEGTTDDFWYEPRGLHVPSSQVLRELENQNNLKRK